MTLFESALDQQQKESLLVTSLYNDLRLYEDSPSTRTELIGQLFESRLGSLAKNLNAIEIDEPVNRDNWEAQITEIHRQLLSIPGTKPIDRSFVLNLWLYHQGLCPLVHFAFDRWFELDSLAGTDGRCLLHHLADLSTTFLYRLIPVDQPYRAKRQIGVGAYSNVYRSDDDESVYKIPRNLAAHSFANYEEYVASLLASETDLAPYLPRLIGFDARSSVIQREFIEGTTGFKLLDDKKFSSDPYGLDQIEEIFRAACVIYKNDKVNFDIHPGNMLWSDARQKWFLVDLGPMPEIGADYFPRDSFQKYFQKIWLDLYDLIRTVPIRSLDLNVEMAHLPTLPEVLVHMSEHKDA